jgi:hypothetical protein
MYCTEAQVPEYISGMNAVTQSQITGDLTEGSLEEVPLNGILSCLEIFKSGHSINFISCLWYLNMSIDFIGCLMNRNAQEKKKR